MRLVNLQRLCRVCGSILTGRKHLIKDQIEQLKTVFRTDFTDDTLAVQPENVCHQCFAAMSNSKKRGTPDSRLPRTWLPHQENCDTCCHIKIKSVGGRLPKRKASGGCRPTTKEMTPEITTNDILNLSPPKPVPHIIEECLSHVMSIKIKQSKLPNNTVKLTTQGSQVTIMYIYTYIS